MQNTTHTIHDFQSALDEYKSLHKSDHGRGADQVVAHYTKQELEHLDAIRELVWQLKLMGVSDGALLEEEPDDSLQIRHIKRTLRRRRDLFIKQREQSLGEEGMSYEKAIAQAIQETKREFMRFMDFIHNMISDGRMTTMYPYIAHEDRNKTEARSKFIENLRNKVQELRTEAWIALEERINQKGIHTTSVELDIPISEIKLGLDLLHQKNLTQEQEQIGKMTVEEHKARNRILLEEAQRILGRSHTREIER